MARMTLDLPDPLHRALVEHCEARGVSLSSASRNAIAKYLRDESTTAIAPVAPKHDIDGAMQAIGDVGRAAEQAMGVIGSIVDRVKGGR